MTKASVRKRASDTTNRPTHYVAAGHPRSISTIHAHQTRLLEVALAAATAVPLLEAVRVIRQGPLLTGFCSRAEG